MHNLEKRHTDMPSQYKGPMSKEDYHCSTFSIKEVGPEVKGLAQSHKLVSRIAHLCSDSLNCAHVFSVHHRAL